MDIVTGTIFAVSTGHPSFVVFFALSKHLNKSWEEQGLGLGDFPEGSWRLGSQCEDHLGSLRSGSFLKVFGSDDLGHNDDELSSGILPSLWVSLGELNHALEGKFALSLIGLEGLNHDGQNWCHEWSETVDNTFFLNAAQEADSSLQCSNFDLHVGILKSLLKDGVEASLMASELSRRQVALRENLEDVECKLFSNDISVLSPLSNKLKKSLTLSSKSVNFGKNVTLSLKEKKWLCLEIKRFHDSFLHLSKHIRVNAFAVLQEVLFEKDARCLSNLSVIALHVGHEHLHKTSWIAGSLAVELSFCSLSGSVVSAEDGLYEICGFHVELGSD